MEQILAPTNCPSCDNNLEFINEILYCFNKMCPAQWDKKLPDKYDVFDAFEKEDEDVGADLWDAVANAKEIKLPAPSFGGLKFKSGVDIMKSKTEPTFELIEAFLPQHQQILIAGTKKANKSTMCMQMGMALANNEKTFLEFDINAQGMEILYFDMEVGEEQFDYRLQKLATIFPNFTNSGAKRFNRVCKVKAEPNMLQKIDDAVIEQVELIDVQHSSVSFCEQPRLEHRAAAGQ